MQRRVKAGTQKIKLQDSDRPYLLNIASCDESSSTSVWSLHDSVPITLGNTTVYK